ncbi:AAA family ATPase [Pseudarthrobacter sp. YS3]|uniref:AAA family ATPase n=1 Tax=Pseudarthrobacter sp. YS3 TaxID=3453718 RepID=UPI003EEBD2D3
MGIIEGPDAALLKENHLSAELTRLRTGLRAARERRVTQPGSSARTAILRGAKVALHSPGSSRSDLDIYIYGFQKNMIQRPVLMLFCGLPGSGKTTFARERERETGAIRFSTDEWMADLGIDFFDEMRDKLQVRLNELWKELLEHGQSVILEDGTWKREERDALRRVAKRLNAITEVHYFDVPFAELWRRLELRNANPTYGTVPITKELLEESLRRLQRPDMGELSLFDRCVVHSW